MDSSNPIHKAHGALNVIGLPAFNDNLIWVLESTSPAMSLDDTVRSIAIVDPGDAAPVVDYCRRSQRVPISILLTHHHADHTGGVADIVDWMARNYPAQRVRVFGPALESIPGVTDPLSGDESIKPLPGLALRVMDVAGHTRGHLAYVCVPTPDVNPGALFSGDLIFGLGCGRLFEGSAAQMFDALLRIAQLDDTTRVYCAHEYTLLNLPFALKVDPNNAMLSERGKSIRALRQQGVPTVPLLIGEERATNPFLRCDQPALAQAVCAETGASPAEIFAALRLMRDTFKNY